MVFNNDESLILVGEDYYKPLPEESVGVQIYEVLSKAKDQEKIIFIESSTDAKLTIREFLENTCKLASALENAGYKKGDVFGICSENNLYYFELAVAALYLGLIAAPLSFHYTEYELTHVLEICKPKLIFCTKTTVKKYLLLREKCNFIKRIVVLDTEKDDSLANVEYYDDFVNKYCGDNFKSFRPINLNENDLAVLLSSSGTTGLPKSVMISHRNMSANIVNLSDPRYIKQVTNGVFLGLLPFFHAFGYHTIISNLIKLVQTVVMKKFVDVEFFNAIEKYKINILWLVPPLIVFMTKSPLIKNYDLSHIEELLSAAAPLGKDTQKHILEILKLDRVIQGFGMTETTLPVLLVPTINKKIKEGSCGKILPRVSAKVRNPETGLLMKANEVGELCFKGDIIMKGYYNNPSETKAAIDADGWLKSGDLGYYDDDGYFFIVDRLKELIKYKGFQVAPAEIEALLLTHPKIKDCGVVGKKDTDAGEICVAFVVPNGKINEDEIKEFVAAHLSRPKHLHGGVRFVDEIPHAASGKILRRVLREQVG